MSSSILAQLAQLRSLLDTMEIELGLSGLSRNERDVLLAFYSETNPETGLCSSEKARSHPTMRNLSQPTFHRVLRRLVAEGYLEKPDDMPIGLYRLPDKIP
jgi:DNA-binding MarR family transcriptional regulator